jgi:hypothetical protein
MIEGPGPSTRALGRPGILAAAIAAALLAVGVAGTPAWAAQFTFKVPVTLSDLHADVEAARVNCRVEAGAIMGTGSTQLGRPSGGKIQQEALVTVVVEPAPLKPTPGKWICTLTLVVKGAPGPAAHIPPVPSYNHPVIGLRAKAGTPLVTQVEGTLVVPGPR